MTIIIGYVPNAQGDAAVSRGIQEAQLRNETLVVLNASRSDPTEGDSAIADADTIAGVRRELEKSGIDFELRQPLRGKDAADEIVLSAKEAEASLIVIGLRRRSSVGKVIFGSTAQEVLMSASCPVLAVKAAH